MTKATKKTVQIEQRLLKALPEDIRIFKFSGDDTWTKENINLYCVTTLIATESDRIIDLCLKS